MSILVLGDSHIDENSIEELEEVFSEVIKVPSDVLVHLGDYYDKKRPSPREIIFGTKWMKYFKNKYKEVVLLEGNHGDLGEYSNVDYLKYLDIKICKEKVIGDILPCFFGHFMTNESLKSFGEYDKDKNIEELGEYKYTFLGHQHDFQELDDGIWHLGSCRFVSFGETQDKRIAIIENNKVNFKLLETVIPLKNVYSLKELEELIPRTKVRLIFKDFSEFKNNINKLDEYKQKFEVFKIHLEFKEIQKETKKELNKSNIINKWLDSIEDEEVKKELDYEFKKNNLN